MCLKCNTKILYSELRAHIETCRSRLVIYSYAKVKKACRL